MVRINPGHPCPQEDSLSSGTRRGTWITLKVRRWLERAERDFTGASCGGDQRCPWCKQWVNQFNGTHIRPFSDGFMDEIVCGNCQGTSLWKWEMGFAYVTHGEPPHMPVSDFASGPFIQGVIQRAREEIDGRPDGAERVHTPTPAKPYSAKQEGPNNGEG